MRGAERSCALAETRADSRRGAWPSRRRIRKHTTRGMRRPVSLASRPVSRPRARFLRGGAGPCSPAASQRTILEAQDSVRLDRLQQLLLEEKNGRSSSVVAVFLLREAVPFVHPEQVPDVLAAGTHRLDDLLRLAARDPRVVVALLDEELRLDLPHAEQRRDALLHCTDRWVALVTVLSAAQVAPVGLRVLQ